VAGNQQAARRLWAGLPGVAVAVGFIALFHQFGQPEYLGGVCAALVVAACSVLATLKSGDTSPGPVAKREVSIGLLRLSWAPWVVMLLVGLHAVSTNYNHDLPPSRNPPMHALGWLDLVATAVLAVAVIAVHRRVSGISTRAGTPELVFVIALMGAIFTAVYEEDVRNMLQVCACFFP